MGGSTLNGGISRWYTDIGLPDYRPALPGDRQADVAIVGAGLTGLWTAYYLQRQQPDLRIVLLEKEFAGFGASGRNGGWLSAELAGTRSRYAETHGRDGVVQLLRAMRAAVDEVIAIAAAEGIDADIVKDGLLHVARNGPQEQRLAESLEYERTWGAGPDDYVRLTRDELDGRIRVAGARGAIFTPHCARVQPAKLVRGLAEVVERGGATIYEQTTVTDIAPGRAVTDRGTVTAPIVLRCLEGFTASIRGQRRNWLPMNSSIVVTAPLADDVHREIGWPGAELLGVYAHAYMYAQRTRDAVVGRGITATIDGDRVDVGNLRMFDEQQLALTGTLADAYTQARDSGQTLMIVRRGDRFLGIVGVMDASRAESAQVLSALRGANVGQLVMISGDNQRVADAVGREVGVDTAIGELLPEDKVAQITRLAETHRPIAMVGDGVNDAPAMARADVGIAMGAAGSTVALETCDIALMSDDLGRVPFAVRLSRATSRIIRQNLIASLAIVAFLILATFLGLNIGAVVLIHEGSTLIVVGNALRLLNFERGKEHHGIHHEDRPTA